MEIPPPAFPVVDSVDDVSCPPITSRILEENFAGLEGVTLGQWDSGSREDDSTTHLVTYLVSGNEISEPYFEQVGEGFQDEQNDTTMHLRIWRYFTDFFPLNNRTFLTEFMIMTDGKDNILAAVAQTHNDPQKWTLEVDIEDSQNYDLLAFTLIHEFAHLLTLGPDQVPPSEVIFHNPQDDDIYLQQVSACPNYFPGEGCANTDSYINAFYHRFWTDLYEEWNEINLEQIDEIYYERLDDFYIDHQDQFVSDYSVTHPAEDIAESFAFFVLSPRPTGGSIAEQKIRFFYEYPELIDLRLEILQNLCTTYAE